MYLERFFDEGLAHASYLVGCQASGDAIVIDAARHTKPYREAAAREGLRIVAVTETHIHADYLSGTRQLAHETGAKMYLSAEGGDGWQYTFLGPQDRLIRDGDLISIGNLTLKVLHTPGHTPEHLSFELTDRPATEAPLGVFTGDFVFVGDVGRPDLLERAAGFKETMRLGAHHLFDSLQAFASRPDHLQIWPAHGAGSACGKALGSLPSSVLAYEKLSNWGFKVQDEARFVDEVLEGQPEPPKYFAHMKRINKLGPPLLEAAQPRWGGREELRRAVEQGQLVIDLRGVDEFVAGHLPGSIYLPTGKQLVTWAGWLIPYDQPFSVLLGAREKAEQTLLALQSIGLDQVEHLYLPDALEGQSLRSSERVKPNEIDWDQEFILDVRSAREFAEGHLPQAHNIHLGYLTDRLDEIPNSPLLHCRSGMRSLIASSLLERAGKSPKDVVGGYDAILKEATNLGGRKVSKTE